MTDQPLLGVPAMGKVTFSMLGEALRRGWADFKRAPGYGVVFASVYIVMGWGLAWITYISGQSYWLIFAAVGFPILGPFAAVGLYETSRRIARGEPLDLYKIFGVVTAQGKRQLPSISAIIIFMFLFWFFIAHMIFALFMGLSTMTNVSSSFEIYLTSEGLMMLAVGTVVGAGFALLLFMITVISLPLLLDREVDFVTAMITSFTVVSENFVPMVVWGAFIGVVTLVSMAPLFLGLFLTLPLLGHATWHLYALICEAGEAYEADYTVATQAETA